MSAHLRRWGAVYVLFAMFAGSWAGQFAFQLAEARAEASDHGQAFSMADFWPRFLAATFENWQSEFLQLAFQAIMIASVLLGPRIFAADRSAEGSDLARVEGKVDQVLRRLGGDG